MVRGPHYHCLDQVPDLFALASSYPKQFPYWLDTSAPGPAGGTSLLLYASGEVLLKHPSGQLEGPGEGRDFFTRLEHWYQRERSVRSGSAVVDGNDSPFVGGWFLFLAYEMAQEVEAKLALPANATGLPDAIAARCPGAIIIFHAPQDSLPVAPRALICAESAAVLDRIRQLLQARLAPAPEALPALQWLQAEAPDKFESGVNRVLHYLRAGDVFQVNISRHWQGRFDADVCPVALYRRLRAANPAPFAGMMQWQGYSLLSSSPERLVQIRGTAMQTRPIAGTRPRGTNPALDLALSNELIENVKERAEHIMLIDLERNDMGRVCRPGSIEVDELMVIESYAHVHHIVSNVRGDLMPDASPIDAIKAVFPGGTISGCPKVRCMEIIAELEQVGRGFYTGCMGYLGLDGSLDLNILIRSMLQNGRDICFRTGAGIVADSIPGRELDETREKARGMLLALQSGGAEARNA